MDYEFLKKYLSKINDWYTFIIFSIFCGFGIHIFTQLYVIFLNYKNKKTFSLDKMDKKDLDMLIEAINELNPKTGIDKKWYYIRNVFTILEKYGVGTKSKEEAYSERKSFFWNVSVTKDRTGVIELEFNGMKNVGSDNPFRSTFNQLNEFAGFRTDNIPDSKYKCFKSSMIKVCDDEIYYNMTMVDFDFIQEIREFFYIHKEFDNHEELLTFAVIKLIYEFYSKYMFDFSTVISCTLIKYNTKDFRNAVNHYIDSVLYFNNMLVHLLHKELYSKDFIDNYNKLLKSDVKNLNPASKEVLDFFVSFLKGKMKEKLDKFNKVDTNE